MSFISRYSKATRKRQGQMSPSHGQGVALLGVVWALSACAPVLPSGTVPHAHVALPSDHAPSETPPEPVIPGVGILSHEHEEHIRLPQTVHMIPAARTDTPDGGTPRPVRVPAAPEALSPAGYEALRPEADAAMDVYALSPYARALAQSPGPHMLPSGRTPPHAGARDAPSAAPADWPHSAWASLAREAEEIFGLDAGLILAVIRAESAFDSIAVSPAGAQGAMQVMPHTQEELGLIDPFDPRANVYAGTQYLMELRQRFGSVELALAAYNAGPAAVEHYGGIPPFPETRDFVDRVMTYWQAGKKH